MADNDPVSAASYISPYSESVAVHSKLCTIPGIFPSQHVSCVMFYYPSLLLHEAL